MGVDVNAALQLVNLQNRLTAAFTEVNNISRELMRMDMDIKIFGWDWDRPGNYTSISTQQSLHGRIVNVSERPER